MAELLLGVMLLAATLYAVLAGADFGVGIVEPLLSKEQAARIDAAISPVWEANHVWLVLMVVLAFVGMPGLFATLCISLHIPLVMALLGIVARGTAFTFRHYDPEPGSLHQWYSWLFRFGSLLTPMFLGVTVAACVEGRLSFDTQRDFYSAFIAPWNTPFCWMSGLFVCALFAFQGVALLAAEQADDQGPLPLLRTARVLHLVAMATGACALFTAFVTRLTWLNDFARVPSIACLVLATVLTPLVAYAFAHARPWLLRLAVGGQVAAILVGLFAAQYPLLLRMEHGAVTLENVVAPAAKLRALIIAVAIGLALIVPSMLYLLRVYKLSTK